LIVADFDDICERDGNSDSVAAYPTFAYPPP
jgi:hypothetical protein